MRPRSMTGFGRGEAQAEGRTWTVEIKTVNHRFLDQRIVLPRSFSGLEERVKKLIAGRLDRGRVEVNVGLQGDTSAGVSLQVNMNLAEQYHRCLQQINEELGLGYHIGLGDMLTLRDVIRQQEEGVDLDAEWKTLSQAVTAALDECDRMREQEGQSLKNDLGGRLQSFTRIVRTIEEQVPELLELRQQELKVRIEKLLDGLDMDPVRFAQEAAYMADKADVTEEIVRLHSHIDQFDRFLAGDEPVGRRLDFLLQEFLREVNTLASKISNGSIAHLGVEMKNEIEKLREQVQNIE
ncbi:MAG: YicC family protein [Desulfobulbaceae bacterium]|nr:YicC family protein [Desulfobulbaceae bacterium]